MEVGIIKKIEQEIIEKSIYILYKKLEDFIIEGLKRKGFEFNNNIELEHFLKTRCKRNDNIKFKEHIYYVDDIAFFLHRYEIIQEPFNFKIDSISININYGSYCYL